MGKFRLYVNYLSPQMSYRCVMVNHSDIIKIHWGRELLYTV